MNILSKTYLTNSKKLSVDNSQLMKKKILFVYYQNVKAGGVAKVMSTLASELVKDGYDVEILFLMAEHDDFYEIDKRIKKHYIDTFSHWSWKVCEFANKYLNKIPHKYRENAFAYIYHIGVASMLTQWINKNHQDYNVIISCWYKLSSILSLNKKVCKKNNCMGAYEPFIRWKILE